MSSGEAALSVGFGDIEGAARLLDGVAIRTPVMTSRTVNERTAGEVFFKCENFQRTGSFKFRGAYHALSRLDEEQRRRGVVTFSSGNHAQAVALAGRLLGVPTVIVMPEDAPHVKREATIGYGAEVVLYDRRIDTREALGRKLADERGLTLIPPFDHPHIIAGQGTAALELFNETGALDAVIVCVGGGGLISGWSLAAHAMAPGCEVYGAEPLQGDDAARSLRTGTLHRNHDPITIADGARTTSLGEYTFPIVRQLVREIVAVEEEEILDAMRFLWERMKVVAEPTGALATAALFHRNSHFAGKRVGVVISGGNADVGFLARLLG